MNIGEGYLYTVIIPKRMYRNTMFGSCTCNGPKKMVYPALHPYDSIASCRPDSLLIQAIIIMPYWLTMAHWRKQYPQELKCFEPLSIKSMIRLNKPDDKIWTPRKAGCPKGDSHEKCVADHIE